MDYIQSYLVNSLPQKNVSIVLHTKIFRGGLSFNSPPEYFRKFECSGGGELRVAYTCDSIK